MPLNEFDHTLIEKHLLQQLSSEEQNSFEERLRDPDFQKELDLQSDLQVSFKAEGRSHLKDQLQGFEEKIKKNSPARRFSIGRALAIAASLLLLLFAVWTLSDSAPSHQELYAHYYEPYPNVVAPIDKGNGEVLEAEQAYQNYELKNYELALQQFSGLGQGESSVRFYQGLCRLALGEASSALAQLETITDQGSTFHPPALWYRALAHLQLGETEEAKNLLQELGQSRATPGLKSRAKALLENLGN